MEIITEDFLIGLGFYRSGTANLYVLKSTPRIGYFIHTHEMIIGYAGIGNMVREQWQMYSILQALRIR